MDTTAFDLPRYLDRIGYPVEARGDLPADAPTLARLMRGQLFSVPFENLDVQAGRGVSLDPAHIVDKIVGQRRGGYCYEVNGLFAMALQALGIRWRFVAARPMFYPVRRPRTHMAVVATVGGEDWLCDLGFGSYGPRAPLRLSALDQAIDQDDDRFMLSRPDGGDYLLQAFCGGQWLRQYGFDLSPQEWVDFEPANHLNSTHPGAIFVQKRVIVRHHEAGRDILLGRQLKTIRQGVVHERELAPDEVAAVLERHFGLPDLAPEALAA